MAGMFGLFDYTKEGPGVTKQQAQKKGFFTFFELYFRNFWALAKLSAVSFLLCLPLVTNGLANCGLTHVTRSMARQKHSFGFSDYFETIQKNKKQAWGFGLLNVLVTALLGFDLYFFYMNLLHAQNAVFAVFGLGVSLFFAVCVTFIKYYLWTMIITFSLPFKVLLKNCFRCVFLNIWRNLLISVSLGLLYAVMIIVPIVGNFQVWSMLISLILAIFIFPGFKAFLVQANTFPTIKKYMIDPYYAVHKGEDIEKRLALGLEVPADELPQRTEAVFNDDLQTPGGRPNA